MAWLYQRKGSENWWIGHRLNGRQILESTGTSDEKKAKAKLSEINQMIEAKKSDRLSRRFFESLTGTATTQTLKAEAADWLSDCAGSIGKATHRRYQDIVGGFLEHIEATETGPLISEVSEGEVRAYGAWRVNCDGALAGGAFTPGCD